MYLGITLNPEVVRFDTFVFEDAVSVEVDRSASRTVEDFTDLGPHAGFVDCPEVRTTIRITRRIGPESLAAPFPGTRGTLTFYTSPAWSAAGQKRVQVRAVVTAVEHTLKLPSANAMSKSMGVHSAQQSITLLAESTNGAADPVTVDDPPVAV